MTDPPKASRSVKPVPAATVVLVREGSLGLEVLLTRRPSTMAFGPDIHVFPGGRVDEADRTDAALRATGLSRGEAGRRLGIGIAPDGGLTAEDALAHFVAAVRETAEETGIDIDAADLVSLTRWVTPPSMPRRFDVRFFAAFVPPGTEVVAGSAEVTEAVWLRPAAALRAAADGSIELWQPTFVTLQQLAGLEDPGAVREAFRVGTAHGEPAIQAIRPGWVRVDAAWAGGIPGRRATGWLVGDREVVVVDPADPTGVTSDAIERFVDAAGTRLAGVAITDTAPVRHAGVEMLAHGLGLPVAGPRDAVGRVPYPLIGIADAAALPFGTPPVTLHALDAERAAGVEA